MEILLITELQIYHVRRTNKIIKICQETVEIQVVLLGVSAVSDGRWVAAVCIGGRRISKTFSTDRNGPEAFTLACLWRREKLVEANVLGENYTERHGKGK